MPVYVPRNLVRRTYTWWQWWKALERKREGGRESESNRNGRRRHFLKYLLNGGALSTASITSEVTISEEDNVLIMGVRGQYRHLDVLIPQSSVTLYRFQLSLSPWLAFYGNPPYTTRFPSSVNCPSWKSVAFLITLFFPLAPRRSLMYGIIKNT